MKYIFDGAEFKGYYAAEKAAKSAGYTTGSMERDKPIAVFSADIEHYAPKWRHLMQSDKKLLAGTIEGDERNGPVTLTIFDDVDVNPYIEREE